MAEMVRGSIITNGHVVAAHAILSGQMPARLPIIESLARTQDRINKRLGARAIVVVRAGLEQPEQCYLFRADHRLHKEFGDAGQLVDLYRTRRKPDSIPAQKGVKIVPIDRAVELRPVSADEIAAWRASKLPDLAERLDDEQVAHSVRHARGDLSHMTWLLDSPYVMGERQAENAGTMHLLSKHLYCGVRQVHGRWEAYRGLGGYLVVEATVDTREEAEILAQAHLWRAWLARVEEIRAARMGDLSWGEPIGCPHLDIAAIGNPQWGGDHTHGERELRQWSAADTDALRREKGWTHEEFARRLTDAGYTCTARASQEWAQGRRNPGAGFGLAMIIINGLRKAERKMK